MWASLKDTTVNRAMHFSFSLPRAASSPARTHEETPLTRNTPSFAYNIYIYIYSRLYTIKKKRTSSHRCRFAVLSRAGSSPRRGTGTKVKHEASKGAAPPYDGGAPLLARAAGVPGSTVQESSLLDPRYINPTCQACRAVTYWRLFTSPSCAVRVQRESTTTRTTTSTIHVFRSSRMYTHIHCIHTYVH